MAYFAYCFRSGELEFGPAVPSGAIKILRGYSKSAVERRLLAKARLAYDGKTLLVPGVPEAESDEAALAAMIRWKSWALAEAIAPHLSQFVAEHAENPFGQIGAGA